MGRHGSGTIFFSSCNLKCLFCQNYDISHLRSGQPITTGELAALMLSLQAMGCHNINLVTPTHFTAQIVQALARATERGLHIPIVYNCGGYESVETLALLDGIVDIYMPDIKYSDNRMAKKWSGVSDYWDVVRLAVKEMHRQVGDLRTDGWGIARRGLLVRHLVLPTTLPVRKRCSSLLRDSFRLRHTSTLWISIIRPSKPGICRRSTVGYVWTSTIALLGTHGRWVCIAALVMNKPAFGVNIHHQH